MKTYLKFAIAVIFHYTGLTSWRLRALRKRYPALILMYHRVLSENDPDRRIVQPGLYVGKEVFEKQMAFLSRRFKVISLGQLNQAILSKDSEPGNYAVVTFDDGWRDNYENAFPVMNRHNIPATIFLATDFIGTRNILWFYLAGMVLEKAKLPPDKLLDILRRTATGKDMPQTAISQDPIEILKALDHDSIMAVVREISSVAGIDEDNLISGDNRMLNWDQVIEMTRGGIEFGSHGCSHRILTGLSASEVKEELIHSKKIIEEKLGRIITLFSYPNGDYSAEIQTIVKEAGYACAVVTVGNDDNNNGIDILGLRRIGVHHDVSISPGGKFSEAMFAFHISGWPTIFKKSKRR
jgi:peptidoglycan/xylan/chitin deacetylase (PgdA/CDA1 family)